MDFIFEQILFYFALILVMFVPGFFLLTTIFETKKHFSLLEITVFSIALSIVSVDFLMILMGKMGILLNFWSILLSIIAFSIACYLIQKHKQKKRLSLEFKKANDFSKSQTILIILILFLTIFIRTAHLKNAIFPTATDLGHHMYWSKLITITHQLPTYQEQEIEKIGENYHVSEPAPIADFIIGEHLIFAAISMLSGIGFVSYFPTLVLFLINIAGILAVFLITLKLFQEHKHSKNIAIATLLFIGPLYAISSPQSNFVSGGVIGNMLGNLLIPVSLLFLLSALRKKDSAFLFAGILSVAGMVYTHHLSTFIFAFIFAFIFVIFNILFVFNSLWFSRKKEGMKNLFNDYKFILTDWIKMIFSKKVLVLIAAFIVFFFFIFTPAYIETSAVNTAVGTPSKSTRAGLTLTQIKFNVGESRMALVVLSVVVISILLIRSKKDSKELYSTAFALGWVVSIFMMVTMPKVLHLNVPSGRIGSYFVFPSAVMAGFSLIWILKFMQDNKKFNLPYQIALSFCVILLIFIITNGMYDNSQSFENKKNYREANNTYHASQYLSHHLDESDIVLKDHNYLKADTWMKIFFMRDYNFPFSRSYFKRYEDPTKPREMCTLWMISKPKSDEGQKCFDETGTNFLVVNPENDSVQFRNLNQFNKIYSGQEVIIFYKQN
jgi:hypothetical protein